MTDIVAELTRLHGEMEVKILAGRSVPSLMRSYKSPLDFYGRRGWITSEQHSAGLELAELFFAAFGRTGSVESNYRTRVGGGRAKHYLDARVWFYQRACAAIRAGDERRMCIQVCCYDLKAGGGEEMLLLRGGLDDLVRHFRRGK